jgi:hypothetical protein
MAWFDHLEGLLRAVAEGTAGQVGSVAFYPPDDRTNARMCAQPGSIAVGVSPDVALFTADQAKEAAHAYVALVEGEA